MKIEKGILIPETINNRQYHFKVTAWKMKPGDSIHLTKKSEVHAMTKALSRLEKKPVSRTLSNNKGWRIWATMRGDCSGSIVKSKRGLKSRRKLNTVSQGNGRR